MQRADDDMESNSMRFRLSTVHSAVTPFLARLNDCHLDHPPELCYQLALVEEGRANELAACTD